MSVVAVNLGASLLIMVWLFRRGRARNVITCTGAVLAFFAFGPLVNLIMGNPMYDGIVVERLGQATTGFTLALGALAIADRVRPQRGEFTPGGPSSTRTYELLPLVLLCLPGYALFVVATEAGAMLGADKLERLELAGRWHYPFLLVEACAVATYFIARRFDLARALYWVNVVAFLAYCLVTAERDFVFLGLALIIQAQLFRHGSRSRRIVLGAALGAASATVLAALREGLHVGVTQTLNQGSVAFVDTFVMSHVPAYWPHRHGSTYLDAVLALLPEALHRPAEGLDQWLVELYAPGYSGGYGFSLTGEAYLNFGLLGVPVVFFLLGLGLRAVTNRSDRSDWWTYAHVLLIAALFNALRGDSAQLVATMVYGGLFFAVISGLSTRAGVPGRLEKV